MNEDDWRTEDYALMMIRKKKSSVAGVAYGYEFHDKSRIYVDEKGNSTVIGTEAHRVYFAMMRMQRGV